MANADNEMLALEGIQNIEENQESKSGGTVISLKMAKLLKLKRNMIKLNDNVNNYYNEIRACKTTCEQARELLGEVNDNIKREGE